MERPRIRHIAINVQDRDSEAEYYKNGEKWPQSEWVTTCQPGGKVT